MPTRTYDTDDLVIEWHAERCVHVARCLEALPEVFDTRRRPWIQPEHAGTDSIVAAIEQCPTGALRYRWADGRPATPVSETAVAFPVPNGPLVVRGRTRVLAADGTTFTEEDRMALCRCGGSGNQPFCDNTHRRRPFEAPPPAPPAAAESPAERCEPQRESFG